MATTVNKIIEDAFRPFGEPQEGDVLTGHQTQRGLDMYNRMMHEFGARGIDLKDSSGTAITFADQSTGDTFQLADKYRNAVSGLLAEMIGVEFGYQTDISTLVARSWATLYAGFGKRSEATMDTTLTRQVRYY